MRPTGCPRRPATRLDLVAPCTKYRCEFARILSVMSPHPALPLHDGSIGVEAVFAGQVDAATARADDVVLWDDDAVILGVASPATGVDADPPAPA